MGLNSEWFTGSSNDQSEQLVAQEQKVWNLENVPTPPDKLLQTLERSRELGFTFEPHYFRRRIFSRNSPWPGGAVRPRNLFWEMIKEGTISPSAATLFPGWYLIEGIQKPNFYRGTQLHNEDALGEVLASLRNKERITIPKSFRHVPKTSRFAVSHNEGEHQVAPQVATLLPIEANHIRIPRFIELNISGNLYHSEWGHTNTWEWLGDNSVDSYWLSGGDSDIGGLGCVSLRPLPPDYRNDNLAFRLLIEFPQKN